MNTTLTIVALSLTAIVVGMGMYECLRAILDSRRLYLHATTHRIRGFSRRELATNIPILIVQVAFMTMILTLMGVVILAAGCASPTAPTDCLDPALESIHARVEGVGQGDPDYDLAVRWSAECPSWRLAPDG